MLLSFCSGGELLRQLKTLAHAKDHRDTLRAVARAELRQHPNEKIELLARQNPSEFRPDSKHPILIVGGENRNSGARIIGQLELSVANSAKLK